MSKLRNQAGVALVTVLFVGATLTVVGSTATFITINELKAGNDDRRGSAALAFAEAGVDRLMLELRRGSIHFGDISEAGCAKPPLKVPQGSVGATPNPIGTYDAELTAFDPTLPGDQSMPPSPWTAANDGMPPCAGRPDTARDPQWFAITSTGRHPSARRVVRLTVKVQTNGLPIGLYADSVVCNGNSDINGPSLITPGFMVGREKCGFDGYDPFYKLEDFWPGTGTAPVPSAVHALGPISYGKGGGSIQEHPPALNCDANDLRGRAGQSLWDQSANGGPLTTGCPTWTGSPAGPPPTSKFTVEDFNRVSPNPSLSDQDYLTLRDAARTNGLYCFFPTSGAPSCTRAGATDSFGGTVNDKELTGGAGGVPLPNSFVAYFEYEDGSKAQTTNRINWKASWWGCSPTPAQHKTAIVVVRRGSLLLNAGTMTNGALFIPEGTLTDNGDHTFNGTIIAKKFESTGTGTKMLDDCWVANMPGAFLAVTPGQWSELDR